MRRRILARRGLRPDGEPASKPALVALAISAFVVGTSELVVVGVLDPIAHEVGVSIRRTAARR